MPLIFVQRYAVSGVVTDVGTQYIAAGGTFDLSGEAVFELDPTVFTARGTYVLVDYSLGSFVYPGAYASGQAALTALASADDSLLPSSWTVGPLVDDTVNMRITVTIS